MKHFYKMLQNIPHHAHMVALMRQQAAFKDAAGVPSLHVLPLRRELQDTPQGKDFPDLKNFAKGIVATGNGSGLGTVDVIRLDSKGKATLPVLNDNAFFLAALVAMDNVCLLADDESVVVRTGDVWMLNAAEGIVQLINNSDDDVHAMLIEVLV